MMSMLILKFILTEAILASKIPDPSVSGVSEIERTF